MKIDVEYGAIADLADYVDALPDETRNAARLALNDVANGPGLAIYRRAVEQDIAFPPGYLGRDRLDVLGAATNDRLQVVIVGRDRPTSLARFLKGGTLGKYGVTVQVKKGQTRTIARGFPIKLRNGNLGLAIRLKPGESLRNTVGAKAFKSAPGLYLLYGPSVDQVFREIIDETTPEVLDLVRQEFYRQFFRLTGGRRGSR